MCISTFGLNAQSKIIAHRGYWKCEGSAQNSIASLKKAAEAKVYGSEFDVQLTKDKVVVVNHDDNIDGIKISEVNYSELSNIKLKNGECLPTIDDYIEAAKVYPDIRLILEIKPHLTIEEENYIAENIVDKVKKNNIEHRVEYISFSMNICEQLVKLSPTSSISYLNGDVSPTDLFKKGINGIDYNVKVISNNPEWIKEAHSLGMKVNVWTVNKIEQIQEMLDLNVDFITTDYPELALKMAKK